MNRELIKDIFLACGFTIKEGQTDLKEYVYRAAEALIKANELLKNPGAHKAVLAVDPGTNAAIVISKSFKVEVMTEEAPKSPKYVNEDIDIPFRKMTEGVPTQAVPRSAEDQQRIDDMVYKPVGIKTEIHRVVNERNPEVFSTGPMGDVTLTEADIVGFAPGLPTEQEPKYTVNGTHIVNRATGEVIPHDEPVFIMRAKDRHAQAVLQRYLTLILQSDNATSREQLHDYSPHYKAVEIRLRQLRAFADEHPDRMKYPDTTVKACPVEYTDEACERCMSGEGKCLAQCEGKQ